MSGWELFGRVLQAWVLLVVGGFLVWVVVQVRWHRRHRSQSNLVILAEYREPSNVVRIIRDHQDAS